MVNQTSHSTIKEQNKEIVCEENGGLVPSGKCGEDEWCTGPHHRDFAECGKENLCEPSKSIMLGSTNINRHLLDFNITHQWIIFINSLLLYRIMF